MRKKLLLLGIALLSVAMFPFVCLWGMLAREGYPHPVAVRNFLQRDGQIRILLPEDCRVLDASCDDRDAKATFAGSEALIKIGYTWCSIRIQFQRGEEASQELLLSVQKLNNWNRIQITGARNSSGMLDFEILENGMLRNPVGYGIVQQTMPFP